MTDTLYCGGCGLLMTRGDHSGCLSKARPARRTYVEKLESARELANEMAAAAAIAVSPEVMSLLARYSERLNRILDGEYL